MTRNVTSVPPGRVMRPSEHTPPADQMEDPERFRLYRLCTCGECLGGGKLDRDHAHAYAEKVGKQITVQIRGLIKCPVCRGEGRTLDLVATCGSPEAVGVALVTLGREGEWEGCAVGVLDSAGAKNQKWVILPWAASPSARNISDAGRVLAKSRHQS